MHRGTLAAWALSLAAFGACAEQVSWMAPTALSENGAPVALEVVIHTPAGPGPFPVVLFNHGSTGRGDDPALYKQTYTSSAASAFFNERGWAVVYPQRRGRGNSGGLYDEGFRPDRRMYSCDPQESLPGFERAMADLDAVLPALEARKELDTSRMLLAGQSRGGILAVAYAGRHPGRFAGVINFVGGWMSDRCPRAADINHVSLRRGAAYPHPMLWLYAEGDPFYSLQHTRAGFEAFVAAGGRGAFQEYRSGYGSNGHLLIRYPQVWQPAVDAYLARLPGAR
jgi:dienelactone hydrolase